MFFCEALHQRSFTLYTKKVLLGKCALKQTPPFEQLALNVCKVNYVKKISIFLNLIQNIYKNVIIKFALKISD